MNLRAKNPCSICRRAGEKLFLKGEKCNTPHCPLTRRTYGPGQHGARRKRLSEYALQLIEKQKLQATYNLSNRQLRNYFKVATKFRGKTDEVFFSLLERRLDNIVFKAGFTTSRNAARKAITDGHIKVNEKKLDIPSYQVKIHDKITLKKTSQELVIFKNRPEKEYQAPTFIKVDIKKKEATILHLPEMEEQETKIDVARAFEFYSR